jgi:uncharacterized cupredoxin-like copper-binding protein
MGGFRLIGVVAVAAGVLLGGCGSDDDGGSSGSSAQKTETTSAGGGGAGATVNVSETEFKIDPANLKVAKAGKVKFQATNDGQIVHALEVEGPGDEAETEQIQPGQSATVSADLSKAGTYEMYCPVGNHRQQGMEGKVTVPGGGSGTSTSGEDDKGGEDDSGGGGGGGGY